MKEVRLIARSNQLYGAVEGGGTKFICAIGDSAGGIVEEIRIETRDPKATLAQVLVYFAEAMTKFGRLSAIGVGAFGPLDLTPTSPTYGFITSTPKPGWANTDLAGTLSRALNVPVRLDTDVNGAALGELRWGAGQGLQSLAYVTVGTGIGVGVVHHGRAIHGFMHPELGHMLVRRHPCDEFVGICPYHGDCLEGLACGPAVVARTGRTLKEALPTDPIWEIHADYLGQLCALVVLSHSPHRIVIGGGVMQAQTYPQVRARMLYWLKGYIKSDALHDCRYVTPPGLNGFSGIKGALSLAIAEEPR
jgi:fructokinase